mmetsp:Transcript_41430/g.125157  ORF Transcript_41430/g.125157 Transcript_41430/m.125157 type:complete len:303 (+) Transcript_41430:1135-2043(+)
MFFEGLRLGRRRCLGAAASPLRRGAVARSGDRRRAGRPNVAGQRGEPRSRRALRRTRIRRVSGHARSPSRVGQRACGGRGQSVGVEGSAELQRPHDGLSALGFRIIQHVPRGAAPPLAAQRRCERDELLGHLRPRRGRDVRPRGECAGVAGRRGASRVRVLACRMLEWRWRRRRRHVIAGERVRRPQSPAGFPVEQPLTPLLHAEGSATSLVGRPRAPQHVRLPPGRLHAAPHRGDVQQHRRGARAAARWRQGRREKRPRGHPRGRCHRLRRAAAAAKALRGACTIGDARLFAEVPRQAVAA